MQFLLGTEDGDEEHIPHALFTELDEICLREGEDAEWKETARYTAAVGCMGWVWPDAAFFLWCTWDFDFVSVWLQAVIMGLLLWRHILQGVYILIHITLYFISLYHNSHKHFQTLNSNSNTQVTSGLDYLHNFNHHNALSSLSQFPMKNINLLSCFVPVCRWLKFEEDVEDGGERWSKPYVATLSLHSLFELRSCIMNGTVMLDMRANSLEEIAGIDTIKKVSSSLKTEICHIQTD